MKSLDKEVELSEFDKIALKALAKYITTYAENPTRRNAIHVQRGMYYIRQFIPFK